jgi:hypothetical protein
MPPEANGLKEIDTETLAEKFFSSDKPFSPPGFVLFLARKLRRMPVRIDSYSVRSG